MGFYNVIKALNLAKQEGVFRDYAIMGGYAVNYYIEPTYTMDVDTLVLIDNDIEISKIYSYFTNQGYKVDGLYITIDETKVQFLTSTISPLYKEAVLRARTFKFKDTTTRMVSAEHLIALLLVSYRPKDQIRIRELLKVVDQESVRRIVRSHDNQKDPIYQRYQEILGRNQQK